MMEPFSVHQGRAVPLIMHNVDTDMIIPKTFMKTIKRSGLGINLFEELRRHPDGCDRNDFILNQSQYKGASILISGRNFGCGSSREHAPWALVDYGIRVIIAMSFADIFASNSVKNGLLLVLLPAERVEELSLAAAAGKEFTVDLPLQQVQVDSKSYSFDLAASDKKNLLEGLDEISLTLRSERKISNFERQQAREAPWLAL